MTAPDRKEPRAKKAAHPVVDERKERDRRTFEQWLPTVIQQPDLKRQKNGQYEHGYTHTAWRIWQAGQTSPYRAIP